MSESSKGLDGIQNVMQGIQHMCDTSVLKQRLDKCSLKEIKEWKDENSFDLLHHCILNNNMMAVVLFFSRGLFKPPHEPAVWPYLHLVSCLGHRSLVTTIVQELRYQNSSHILDWDFFDITIKPKIQSSIHNFKDEDKEKKLNPIDLAALFGHSICVQILLDFWHFHNVSQRTKNSKSSLTGPSRYLSLACQANSPQALRLLLQEHDDKKEALEFAVRMSSAECVDVVLRDRHSKIDVKTAFQGMNLFHVLYSYSRCTSKALVEAMVEVTSVLLFHEQNVNSCRPSRTFPLYSLLSKPVVGVATEDLITSLTSALLLLLKAGADPNLDEIIIEEHVHDTEYTTAFGRKPFSSAVNCLISSVTVIRGKGIFEVSHDKQLMEKYSYNCLELLLRHGADLSHVGKFCDVSVENESLSDVYHTGTSLHVFFSTRNTNQPCYPFLRLLLHYGLDTDVKGLWTAKNIDCQIRFALNVLPFSLWTSLDPSHSEPELSILNDYDLKLFVYAMKFMSQTTLQEAFVEFGQSIDKLRNSISSLEWRNDLETTHFSGNSIYSKMVQAFTDELSHPWSLQRCCSHVIWKSCGLHMGNIFSLSIPTPLRNIIMHYH